MEIQGKFVVYMIFYISDKFFFSCGKTTLCQFLACLLQKKLFLINCHMHTEAADFLGGLRPTRQKS
ncbi:MAG: hypothetical protein MJE68_06450, partial [Proteobacteria bacterium]|nr:hypothetical protein [Pseudomonadota bacterium]